MRAVADLLLPVAAIARSMRASVGELTRLAAELCEPRQAALAVLDGDLIGIVGLDYRTLDGRTQLAQVVRPRGTVKRPHEIGLDRELRGASVHCARVLREVALHQERNIRAAVTQRRELNAKRLEASIEVGEELLGRDELPNWHIARGDDAHIDPERAVTSHRTDFTVLDCMQQLPLDAEGRFADFVEEDRATLRRYECPWTMVARVGERALHMTEQLGVRET